MEDKIIDYVSETPENTNPAVLHTLLGDLNKQSDWNQNDEKQFDYIKNRPFYTGDLVETEIIPEYTYTLSSFRNFTIYMDESGTYPYSLEADKEYTVVYNGTTYELTSTSIEGAGLVGDANPISMGSEPTMPFAIIAGNGILQIIDYTGNTEVTFKITGYKTEIKKIDTKYIPWNDAVGLYPPVFINKNVSDLTDEEKQKYYNLFNKGALLIVSPGAGKTKGIVISMFYSKTVGLQMALIDTTGNLMIYNSDGWETNDIRKSGIESTVNDILDKTMAWNLLSKAFDSVSIGEAFNAFIFWNNSTGKASIQKRLRTKSNNGVVETVSTVNSDILCSGDKEIVLSSSTADSTKKFKITVDDSGTITATEVS